MPLQYISDNTGNHTAVVIPINEWKLLTSKHEDLKQLELPQKNNAEKKPSDFAGVLSEEGYQALNDHIQKARNEWDRDTN